MAVWDGSGASEYGLCYADPRLPRSACASCCRRISRPRPPPISARASPSLRAYDAHRIALGVPRGGIDFIYGDTFPHEADMDQLAGVDFDKGCYVGQEVVSRVEHRATARSRVVPIVYDDFSPMPGLPVMAGDKQVGTLGSTAKGRGLALLRLDRVADALAAATPLTAGGIAIRVVKPDWATFPFPGETKAAS